MRSLLFIFAALTIIGVRSARADGIAFDGDRVSGWSTTVLTLTDEQVRQVDQGIAEHIYETFLIEPTDAQRSILEASAGFVPDRIVVWKLEGAKDTCTCDVLNMGIRFERDKIEVPHFLLGKNLEDRYKRMRREIERKKKAAEPGATDNPDDAQRLREDH